MPFSRPSRLFLNSTSGMNSIYMYDIAANGSATLLSINLSPTDGDGPRNTYPTKDGRLLYVVCLSQTKS